MARSLKRALAFQKKFRNDIAAHSAFPRLATCAFLLDAPAKISQHCAPRGRTSEVLLPQKAVLNIASLIERQKYFRTQIQRAKPAAPIYVPEKFFRYPPQYPASKFPFQTPREKSFRRAQKKDAASTGTRRSRAALLRIEFLQRVQNVFSELLQCVHALRVGIYIALV